MQSLSKSFDLSTVLPQPLLTAINILGLHQGCFVASLTILRTIALYYASIKSSNILRVNQNTTALR